MLPHHERPRRSDLRRRPRPHRQRHQRHRPRAGRRAAAASWPPATTPRSGALAGPGARVVELRGRSLLPGFIDGHCHLTGLGMAATSIDCKAPGMQSIARAAGGRQAAGGQPAAGHVDPRARLRPVAPGREASPQPSGLGRGGARPSGDLHAHVRPHLLGQRSRAGAAGIDRRHARSGRRALRPRRRTQPRRGLRDRADAAAGGGDAVAPTISAMHCCGPTRRTSPPAAPASTTPAGSWAPRSCRRQDAGRRRSPAPPHLRVRDGQQPSASAHGTARHRRPHRSRRRAAAAGRLQGDDRRVVERADRRDARAVHVQLPRPRHPLLVAGGPRRSHRSRPPSGLPVHRARGR